MVSIDSTSLVLAAVGALVTLLLFVAIAYVQGDPHRFFFAARSLERGRISTNMSATATSLAGLLIFFLIQTPTYGWVTIVVLLFILFGYIIFLKIVQKINPLPSQTGSIYRFIYWRTKSNEIAFFADLIVILNFIVIFVIEVAIGASIFTYFVPELKNAVLYAAIGICIFVLWYVLKGGFNAVTHSDTWQYWLVVVGIGLTIILIFIGYNLADKSINDFFKVFKSPQGSKWIVYTFLLNAFFVNLTLPTTQVTSWQRFSSAQDKKEWRSGYLTGLCFRFWPIILAAIIISALVFSWKGPIQGFGGIFDLLRESGIIGGLLVFPLCFVGLLAALISTADSMLISIMLAFEDLKYSRSEAKSGKPISEDIDVDKMSIKLRLFLIGASVAVVSILATFILQSAGEDLYMKIVQLMFAGYGQAILLFPIMWILSRSEKSKLSNTPTIVGLSLGFVALWSISLYGILADKPIFFEKLIWTHIAAPIALIISSIGVFLASRKKI